MTVGITYRLSERRDLEEIKNLLLEAELPVDDLSAGKITFVLALNESGNPIGCIGLEQYETDGLLRSLAVDSAYRGKGIGHQLLSRLLSLSGQSGVSNLHLLTTTAEKFFARAGFLNVIRDDAPASIKETVEFSSLCPASSTYMVKRDILEEDHQKIKQKV